MGSGSKRTPKGGLKELVAAFERGELSPSETSSKFGEGAYKDEPWSIVALRKRIYALRVRSRVRSREVANRSPTPGEARTAG